MLLVLDNFEQILDAAPLLTQLFTELPETTFLVTSRALLRLRGERVFDVQPLACPIPRPHCASTPRWNPPPCGCSATARGRQRRCSR